MIFPFLVCFQSFKNVLQLIKDAFFKHSEKDVLRSCVKAINFCSSESHGELQEFAQNKLKELEDELISKLISSIKEVAVCSIGLILPPSYWPCE